ncbi:uncharacterized protein [Amphiura filiformis]|uniref:uncharacterized protein isoform X2 n=1 Tax=Amphiura filiformis TaxID=82378 RepID=UPI003B21BBCD
MSLEARLNDPEYQNWLKCGQALLLLVDSLRQFAEDTISTYHGDLKQEFGHLGICQQLCKPKKNPPDTCAICCPWKKKLLGNHSTKEVHWTNVDPKSWPRERWEVAKIYMARGQKPNVPITADDLDSTHMLNLLKNCKEFHKYVPKKLPDKVLQKRNKIMHSSNMKLSNNDLKDIFDLFLQFLQDKMKLHELAETKQAVQQIQELQKMAFDVNVQFQQPPGAPAKVIAAKNTKDLEHKLISIMMEDFNKRLEIMENMEEASLNDSLEAKDQLSQSIEDLQNFVNTNKDLKEDFGKDLEDMKQKYFALEERVEDIEEGYIEMKYRLDAIENKPMPVAPAADYVSLLQQVAAQLKLDKPPEYAFTPEEQGQICTVTVNGRTYRTTKVFRNNKEAKQEAARIAYPILKEKLKSGLHKPPAQVDDPTNYVGELQEYTQKRNLQRPEYSPRNKNTIKMEFTYAVLVELSDGQVVNVENTKPEKTLQGAKQAAAQHALKELKRREKQQQTPGHQPHAAIDKSASDHQPNMAEQPIGTTYKSQLQEHQQKSGLPIPTYRSTQEGNKFKVEVTVPLPNDATKTFECEAVYSSKKEAEHAAARKALETLGVLDELKQPEANVPLPKLKVDAGAIPKVKPEKVEAASPDSTSGSSTQDYKGKLQELLMRSHGATSPPKYEDVEIPSQLDTFRSKVTISAKHMLQSGPFPSKKDAEKNVAKLALEQLESGQEHLNPKGRLLQLHPKPLFITDQVVDTKQVQFQSTLFLSAIEKVNEVVIFADIVGKTKKELKEVQKSVAKKVFQYLEHFNED